MCKQSIAHNSAKEEQKKQEENWYINRGRNDVLPQGQNVFNLAMLPITHHIGRSFAFSPNILPRHKEREENDRGKNLLSFLHQQKSSFSPTYFIQGLYPSDHAVPAPVCPQASLKDQGQVCTHSQGFPHSSLPPFLSLICQRIYSEAFSCSPTHTHEGIHHGSVSLER